MYRGDPTKHRCCALTTKGTQCLRTAMHGYTMCDTHGMRRKYYIRLQRRCPDNGLRPVTWRTYRSFAVWPILFDTQQDARDFMDKCFTFKGYATRKASASIETTRRSFLTCAANPSG